MKVLEKYLNMKSLQSKILRFSVVSPENGLEISAWAGQPCAGRAGPFLLLPRIVFCLVLRLAAHVMPASATTTGTSRAGPSSPTLLLYITFLLSGLNHRPWEDIDEATELPFSGNFWWGRGIKFRRKLFIFVPF